MPIIIREIIPIIYNLFLLLSGTSFSLKDYHEIYINKVIHIQLISATYLDGSRSLPVLT